MPRVLNSFFEIRINGEIDNHTPVTVVSGVLHCVDLTVAGSPATFLPVGYYNEPTINITRVNSLANPRTSPFVYSSESGLGDTLDIITDLFRVTKVAGALTVVSKPPVEYSGLDITLRPLPLHDVQSLDAFPTYNEVDSDVVLTTASPTAWNRPQSAGAELTIKSNVLALIYSALFDRDPTRLAFSSYVILANTLDMAQDATGAPTTVWTFTEGPYNAPSGKFSFRSDVPLTREIVDQMLDSIAPNLLQSNDTLDITVSGIDSSSSDLYTTSIRYTGDVFAKDDPYRGTLFAGLLEQNPLAYANKQAICIAVSKYNRGVGTDTVSFPPFQFRYKQSMHIKILDEVLLDFARYYYIVYHFAPEILVRPLPLFSRPSANKEALRDVIVLSDKYDAHVDIEFTTVGDSKYAFLASSSGAAAAALASSVVRNLTVVYTADGAQEFSLPRVDGMCTPGRGRFQFFTSEGDLYTSRTPEQEIVGPKMRLYFDALGAAVKNKIPIAATTVRIKALFEHNGNQMQWSVVIPSPNIRQYTEARNVGLIELRYQPTLSPHHTPVDIMMAIRGDVSINETFNDDISQWDIYSGSVSGGAPVTFASLLCNLPAFNQPIGCWNTSGVQSMHSMLSGSVAFNQPIGAWDTSRVTTLACMFKGATSFNQHIGDWDVGRVSDFRETFANAASFNTGLSGWKQTADASGRLGSVILADGMFAGASAFNQPLRPTGFVVSRCVGMFKDARSFNQPWRHILSDACTDLTNLFNGARSLAGTVAHNLPAACENTTSMFEGASSWNASLVSTNSPALADMTAMYKDATAFNKPVTVSTSAPALCCSRMFQRAQNMDSVVTVIDASGGGLIELQEMFLEATAFNADVLFNRKITRASRMFKGASVYGTRPTPSLGVVGRCLLDFSWTIPASATPFATRATPSPFTVAQFSATAVASEMFAGSRFDGRVVGRAPRSCEGMFAGTEHYDTPLRVDDGSGHGFDLRGVTSMKGMFQGATGLTICPIDSAPSVLTTVTTMESMFEDASNFNGDVTGWFESIASVTSFYAMFRNAVSFRPNISSGERQWQIADDADVEEMFANARSYLFGPVNLFPRAVATTRSVVLATVGQRLTLSTVFSVRRRIPASATAVVVVTPSGREPRAYPADVSGNAVSVSFTLESRVDHAGRLTLAFGGSSRVYAWPAGTLAPANIYDFPARMEATERLPNVVTLGQTLRLTSIFSEALPTTGMTSTVRVVSSGQTQTLVDTTISGSSVAYDLPVLREVDHSGTVVLVHGGVSREYPWAEGTLTSSHISTFPSAFSLDGRGNGYGGGAHLKSGTEGGLILTFIGATGLALPVASTQVHYVKYDQSGVASATVAPLSVDASGRLVARIVPLGRADMTVRVVLVGPDGTHSSELTRVVPTADIAPQWDPTGVSLIGTSIVAPNKLVVGQPVVLTFAFATAGDFPADASAPGLFSLVVNNGAPVDLTTTAVHATARTLAVAFAAAATESYRFAFTSAYGTAYAPVVVEATEVYTFPTMASTARGVAVVSLGSTLTLTSTFGATLPAGVTAEARITPTDQSGVVCPVDVSGNTARYSLAVRYDAAHSGVVTLRYGSASRQYSWAVGTLTSGDIHTFPSAMTCGSFVLKQATARDVVLTLAGGDGLFSSVVSEQVEYVRYTQGNHTFDVATTALDCSGQNNTVLIKGLAPSGTSALTFTLKLRGPDGVLSSEITLLVPSAQIAPQWLPTAAGAVSTTTIASPYKLVNGAEIILAFGFSCDAPFPNGATATGLFASLQVDNNGAPTSLASATVDSASKTVTLPFTATAVADHAFVFTSHYGATYSFTIRAAECYAFPSSMTGTTRGVEVATLGTTLTLTLTSTFSEALQAGTTASCYIVPKDQSGVVCAADVSGNAVSYRLVVLYDTEHSGVVTLRFGGASRAYAWATGVLTAPHIYTFPSGFSAIGTSGFGTGVVLKQATSGNVALTFVGGDGLLASSVSGQGAYVKYDQSGVVRTVDVGSLACNDSSGVISITGLVPSGPSDLTFRVKLSGPDGVLSSELTLIVPSAQIMPQWFPKAAGTVSMATTSTTTSSFKLVNGRSVPLVFGFLCDAPFPAATSASSIFASLQVNGVPATTSLSSSTVGPNSNTISFPFTATSVASYVFVFSSIFGASFSFTVSASEIYTPPTSLTCDGTLKVMTAGAVVLTFTTGVLWTSVVSSQVGYVKFTQTGLASDITIATGVLTCTPPSTITIGSITPMKIADLVVKVQLIGPDGLAGPDITGTIPASAIDADYLILGAFDASGSQFSGIVGTRWTLTPTSTLASYTRYQADVLGDYANVSKPALASPMMTWGASIYTQPATPFATNKSGAVRYLLIIENEAYTFVHQITNMVKWRATLASDSTKYIQCSDSAYGNKGMWSNGGFKVNLVMAGTGVVASTFLKAVYVNGASVSVDGTLTAVGPLSAARGADRSQIYSDYTTCIVFSADVYVEVLSLNQTDASYPSHGYSPYYTRASLTLPSLARLGMFAAYPATAYASDSAFVAVAKATSSVYAIPWLMDAATFAAALLRHHGCVADMSKTLENYSYSPTFTGWVVFDQRADTRQGLSANPNPKVYPFSASLLNTSLRFTQWPFMGGGYTPSTLSGYFNDPITGLPVIGQDGTTTTNWIGGVTIMNALSGLRFVAVNIGGSPWNYGVNIPGTTSSPMYFNGGTITAAIGNDAVALMPKQLCVSWVGSIFPHAPYASTKFASVFNGFALFDVARYVNIATLTAASSSLQRAVYDAGCRTPVVVWDLQQAVAGTTWSNTHATTYMTNTDASGCYNVRNCIMWMPLGGSNPFKDPNPSNNPIPATSLSIFTLQIDRSQALSDDASIDRWIKVYQNGVPLTRCTQASEIGLSSSTSATKPYCPNVILTDASGQPHFTYASDVCGTPHFYLKTPSGIVWRNASNTGNTNLFSCAFAESSVVATSDPTSTIAGLGTKWGVVTAFTALTFKVTGAAAIVVSNYAFFVDPVSAMSGTSPSWARGPNNTWTYDATRTSTITDGQSVAISSGLPTATRTAGTYLRFGAMGPALVGTTATSTRLSVELTHADGSVVAYRLMFHFGGEVRFADEHPFIASDGTFAAKSGVFELVRSTSPAWTGYAYDSTQDGFVMPSFTAPVIRIDAEAQRIDGGVTLTFASTRHLQLVDKSLLVVFDDSAPASNIPNVASVTDTTVVVNSSITGVATGTRTSYLYLKLYNAKSNTTINGGGSVVVRHFTLPASGSMVLTSPTSLCFALGTAAPSISIEFGGSAPIGSLSSTSMHSGQVGIFWSLDASNPKWPSTNTNASRGASYANFGMFNNRLITTSNPLTLPSSTGRSYHLWLCVLYYDVYLYVGKLAVYSPPIGLTLSTSYVMQGTATFTGTLTLTTLNDASSTPASDMIVVFSSELAPTVVDMDGTTSNVSAFSAATKAITLTNVARPAQVGVYYVLLYIKGYSPAARKMVGYATFSVVDPTSTQSPLWTAWRSDGSAGDTYAQAISARGATAYVGTVDNVKKAIEAQGPSMALPMPGSFAFLPIAPLRSGAVRPASWATFGTWYDGAGAFDVGKYGEWVASTFDTRMFKVRTTGAVWTGTAADVLDLEFRYKGRYSCDNPGGAMYHLMYPKKDQTGLFQKATESLNYSMGPTASVCGVAQDWYFRWGYKERQPATRICISRLRAGSVSTGNNTITCPMGDGDPTHVTNWLGMTQSAWRSALNPAVEPGSYFPYTSLRKGTNFSAKIYVHATNDWDGTDNWPHFPLRIAEIDVSEWLKYNGSNNWGTSDNRNQSDGCNQGSAVWFPLGGDPAGYKYYEVSTQWPERTAAQVSNNGYTINLYNSPAWAALTFVLGGAPDTPLFNA